MHRHLGVAFLAATVAGCAATGATAREPEQDCQGLSVLVIMNATEQSVMILEGHRNSGASTAIATVGPGNHEITVRSEADYNYRAVAANSGSIVAQRQVSRGNAVRMQRECRAPGGQEL